MSAGISWLDAVLLAVLLLSVVVGLFRGLVFELMSLAGWIVAYIAAVRFAPDAAAFIPVGEPGGALNHSAAFAASFIAALVIWALLAKLVRMAIAATPLTVPDRLLGAAFGALRALVLLLALATVVLLTPAAQSQVWKTSLGAQWLAVTLHGIKPLLPAALSKWLPD